MYGKAFESQYKGSLVGAGFAVFAVWNYVIANTHYGVVELNPKLLGAILGGPPAEVESAIEFLCRPDPESRSKDEDGRRMVREGQFQYRVVNWGTYQTIKSEEALKDYNRRKQAEYRAGKKARAALTPEQKQAKSDNAAARRRVRAENESREARSVKAQENGDLAEADRIAAEGLPPDHPS